MQTSRVHEASRAIGGELKGLNIPFAIAGALATNAYGYRRMTDVVEILLSIPGLAEFKKHCLGRGWVEIFPGFRGLRDVTYNVKIDVLLTGGFPGDGKPKPISFPEPTRSSIGDPLPYLSLKELLELKMASGMTAAHRMQDLADVMNLIKVNQLSEDYVEQLNPYVAQKYRELWELAQINEDY